ncbi:MAG: radical SAM protein [Promethearchaeota archaeon]
MAYIKETSSICPECLQQISATIYEDEKDNNIYMKKTCPEHGDFKDIIAGSTYYYLWRRGYHHDSLETPLDRETGFNNGPFSQYGGKQGLKGCPYDCGLCENHKSASCICLIDITNRCNLKCPICFANAAVTGYVVEPTLEEIETIMAHFRETKPMPPVALQISGGEPTIRNDLPEIVQMSKDMGFQHRMVTTNGLRFTNIDYLQEIIDAGMNAMYWQFDGLERETWIKTRGVDLLDKKMKVVENCRELGYKDVVLVPTIARGVNDHEVGNIMDFAIQNNDVVSCVVFQPVSLCGRITQQEVLQMRYNTTDLFDDINKHSSPNMDANLFGRRFYPIPTLSHFVKLVTWFDDVEPFEMTSHEDCGFATIGIVERNKDPKKNKMRAIDDYFNINAAVADADRLWSFLKDTGLENKRPFFSRLFGAISPTIGKAIGDAMDSAGHFLIRKAFKYGFLANTMRHLEFKDPKNLLDTLVKFSRIVLNPGWQSAASFLNTNALLVSCMHFQDAFNMNVERVSRCLVHYGVFMRDPNQPGGGKVYRVPFCAMNTLHRPILEKRNAELQTQHAEVTLE